MKYVVTGGAGFIGSNLLINWLVKIMRYTSLIILFQVKMKIVIKKLIYHNIDISDIDNNSKYYKNFI